MRFLFTFFDKHEYNIIKKGEFFMEFQVISAKELKGYIGRRDTIVVDLRERSDYQKGHIPTAINIPFDEYEEKQELLKNTLFVNYRNIIFYCDRGNSSLLVSREFRGDRWNIMTLGGGFIGNRGKFIVDGSW